MKVIHTSDWHIGQSLYNYDRTREHENFFSQLENIVRNENPDLLLVCGDVYHYSTPSSAAQKLYTDSLLKIHQAAPEMTIIVTAGNHDSSSKLEVDRSLWSRFGVHVIGNIRRGDDGNLFKQHIIAVKRGEKILGYVAAVPHCYPQNFPIIDENIPREKRQEYYFQSLLEEVKLINKEKLPVILTAHLTVEGSSRKGHDESVGGIEYVSIDSFGRNFDYLALGHIHFPQSVSGDGVMARYSGSPLPVSFDEDYRHSVSVVEFEGNVPHIRTVEITAEVPLLTIPSEPEPFEEALQKLVNFPDDREAYIRLNVRVKDYLPGDCNERVSDVMRTKRAKFCYIQSSREQSEESHEDVRIGLQEVRKMSPVEIARLYYESQFDCPMDEAFCELLEETVRQVDEEND